MYGFSLFEFLFDTEESSHFETWLFLLAHWKGVMSTMWIRIIRDKDRFEFEYEISAAMFLALIQAATWMSTYLR